MSIARFTPCLILNLCSRRITPRHHSFTLYTNASKMKDRLHLSIDDQAPSKTQSSTIVERLSSKWPHLDVKDVVEEDVFFDVERFFAQLTTTELGRVLLQAEVIPSTQPFIREAQDVLPNGAVLVAQGQSQGKGRGTNEWTSPLGCLMFSALSHLTINVATTPFLNYVISVAIIRAIKFLAKRELKASFSSSPCTLTPNLKDVEIDVKIKWPNDIYFENQKIAGILLNSSLQGTRLSLVAGIGLNVMNTHPTVCLKQIFEEAVKDRDVEINLTLEDALAQILNNLEPLMKVFEEDGFEPMKAEYLESWIHTNQRLALESKSVVVKGITKSGFLEAEDENGEVLELLPDGNSIDMMQGLISRKI